MHPFWYLVDLNIMKKSNSALPVEQEERTDFMLVFNKLLILDQVLNFVNVTCTGQIFSVKTKPVSMKKKIFKKIVIKKKQKTFLYTGVIFIIKHFFLHGHKVSNNYNSTLNLYYLCNVSCLFLICYMECKFIADIIIAFSSLI